MGFIISTIATAITFAIVAYVLPQIDFNDDVVGLLILSVIAGLVNGVAAIADGEYTGAIAGKVLRVRE